MPKFKLQKLSPSDGKEIYDMLQKIPREENSFQNGYHGMSFEEFKAELKDRYDESLGVNIKPDRVPQTTYWFFVDDKPVGFIKVRHYLNDRLKEIGGHIGYTIAPEFRGKGYATKMLELALIEAKKLGIDKVRLTCYSSNVVSRRVIEKNGGILEGEKEGSLRFWV